jgi:hypothetical protein
MMLCVSIFLEQGPYRNLSSVIELIFSNMPYSVKVKK